MSAKNSQSRLQEIKPATETQNKDQEVKRLGSMQGPKQRLRHTNLGSEAGRLCR